MYESNLYGTIAARLAGVPVIITSEHGENPWKRNYQRWLERHVISPGVDSRFCVSPRILEVRRDIDGIPESKLKVIVNGTVVPPREEPDSSDPTPVIGAAGRFIPAKDFPGLMDAAAELRRRGLDFKLYVLGNGPEAEKVRERISRLGLERTVQLPGMVADIDQWYRKFDIFVSSSVREGLPVVLLEAMAHGLPVVTTDVGACSETVCNRVGGLVVPPGQPNLLADALASLITNPQLRNEYGGQARQRVEEHYSVAHVAALHEKHYEEVLAQKQSETGVRA
jgi:glycosyltransferase involved in cell wall biosynthesis